MFNVRADFQTAYAQQYGLVGLALIHSRQGLYVFSRSGAAFDAPASITAGAGEMADGFFYAGDVRVLANEARVISFPPFKESLVPASSDAFAAWTQTQLTEYTLALMNADRWCTGQLRLDPFLGARLEILFGFMGIARVSFQYIFRGRIIEQELALDELDLRAVSYET